MSLDGLWSVVTLGMGSSSTAAATTVADGSAALTDPAFDLRNRHLSNQSIHLLLILSNHFTNDVHRNPYRLALLHFTDTQGKTTRFPTADLSSNMFTHVRQSNESARFRTVAMVLSRLPSSVRCPLSNRTHRSEHLAALHATSSKSAFQSLRHLSHEHRSDRRCPVSLYTHHEPLPLRSFPCFA